MNFGCIACHRFWLVPSGEQMVLVCSGGLHATTLQYATKAVCIMFSALPLAGNSCSCSGGAGCTDATAAGSRALRGGGQ